MQAWCLGVVFVCLAGILSGTVYLNRARGLRVTSGRRAAAMAYLGLLATMVLGSMIVCLAGRVYAVGSARPDLSPDFSRIVVPLVVTTLASVVAALVSLWLCARSLGRSVIFHNIRRDDLAVAVAAALRQLQVAASHRLRTFRDDFVLPDARLLVHGAVGMSRLEWIGLDEASRTRIVDATIERLKDTLQADGRVIFDGRG